MKIAPIAGLPDAPPHAVEFALRAAIEAMLARNAADPAALALDDFYAGRDDAPVWVTEGGRLTPSAVALLDRLDHAGEDGLDPRAFQRPDAGFLAGDAEDPAEIAAAEILLSRAAVAYAQQAQAGRLRPRAVWALATLSPEVPEAAAVLQNLAAAQDVAAALESYNPPHPEFRRLKAALAAARAALPPPPANAVPDGPSLVPGARDPRVGVLRLRLAVAAAPDADPDLYDALLRDAVVAFQRSRGLAPDGVVGLRTIAALNGRDAPGNDRIAVILANMERWRWMPRDLGRVHVFVDIPGFRASVVRDGTVTYSTRVVVGAPPTPTPVFSDEIRFVVVNPYWNVPVSIASREMLPKIQANPDGYFASRNYEVVVDGRVVTPSSVAWTRENLARVRIRQRPGDDNALGNIKFMFPNEHAVYLHDTPSKALFAKPDRAFSHGCVRVDDPMAFAAALLADESAVSAGKIRKLIGGRERRLDLAAPVPVHLAYFTATVDEAGAVSFRRDIYGLDARIARALVTAP